VDSNAGAINTSESGGYVLLTKPRRLIGAFGLLVLAVAFTSACLPDSKSSSQRPQDLLSAGATQAAQMAPPTATAFVIEYVVAGDTASDEHRVDVRWHTDGVDDSETNVNVSERVWSRFVTVKPGSALHLEVRNHAPNDNRPVRCEIYLSGQLWDAADSMSDGTGASCDAVAGG
jgi:hypothetical protein